MIRTVGMSLALVLASAGSTFAQVTTSSAAFTAPPVTTAPVFDAPSPWRYGFLLQSTARYQLDNGDRTEVTIEDPNNPGRIIINENYDPTGERLVDVVSTIGGEIAYGPMQLAVRMDNALYFHEPVAAPDAVRGIQQNLDQRYENVYELEYISASYSDRNVDLTLGDFYMTLGRGIILSIRKVGDVGIDNKIRGANGKVRLGDLTLNAFGGYVNIKNFESGTGYHYINGDDLVVGGRAEYAFGKYLKLGTHGVLMRNKSELPQQVEIRGYGATLELPRPVKWLSAYLEIDGMERDREAPGRALQQDDTLAIYGSANVFAGPVTVLLEGKHYDNLPLIVPDLFQQGRDGRSDIDARQLINQYITPPTAERPLLILLTNQTVTGGRVRLDYRITPKIVPFAGFGRYRDETAVRGAGASDAAVDATSVYGGGTFRWDGGFGTINVGYRGQFGGLERIDRHVFMDGEQHLWGDNALELYVNALSARQDNEDWVEGRVALSFKAGRLWSATVAYEFYTRQPLLFREHYPSVAGQWQFADRGIIRALVGGERAGLKCTGGVCRFFPGFEGGRVEFDWRF